MVKIILGVKRKADITHEEFRKYYLEVHAPMDIELLPKLGCRRLVHSYCAPTPLGEAEYDALVELWFDDMAGVDKLGNSNESRVLGEDAKKVSDDSKMLMLFADEERVIIGEPTIF